MKQSCSNAKLQTSNSGFTVIELLTCVVISMILAMVLFPIFAVHPHHHGHGSCASNEKQIGLELLAYTEDYDGKFPPANSLWKDSVSGQIFEQDWIVSRQVILVDKSDITVPPVLDGYSSKNKDLLKCPTAWDSNPDVRCTYMLNDLAVEQSVKDIASPSQSVLMAEGEDQLKNVGHAWEAEQDPVPAVVGDHGLVPGGQGATVKDAPKRHSDGGNYLLFDGHVKWFKSYSPTNTTVFFPPRASDARSHIDQGTSIGPTPGGDMTFNGRTYAVTFHLK